MSTVSATAKAGRIVFQPATQSPSVSPAKLRMPEANAGEHTGALHVPTGAGGTRPVDARAASAVRPAKELAPIFDCILAGKAVEITPTELRTLQGAAIDTAQAFFTNEFFNDGALKAELGKKQGLYQDVRRTWKFHGILLGSRSVAEKQLDSLRFILRTFTRLEPADSALRRVIFDKLRDIGRKIDIDAILPHVRRGDGSDLHHGLEAIYGITARHGTTQKRGGLEKDATIGPLLQKAKLSDDERRKVIEAVLERGVIQKTRRHHGVNLNEVYFLTFAETLPGPDGKREHVEGVFKPERTWLNKNRAFFAREVAAYEFDKRFAKTGMVPPTIEGLIAMGPGGASLGSLQYKIPRARPLGSSPHKIDPRFDGFMQSSHWREQEARLRTLLYILADPDKLPNDVHPKPNYLNVMIDDAERVWMIDNAYAMGAPPRAPNRQMLPKQLDAEMASALHKPAESDVVDRLKWRIQVQDARDVGARLIKVRGIFPSEPIK